MIGHWNQDEDLAMQGLPAVVQLMYLRGIRRFMDAASGLVGIKRGISLGSLSETVEEWPHCGVGGGGRPSKQQVRRMVDRLINSGLLERKSQGKRLVFFLPLAFAYESVQIQVGSKPTQSRHIQADTHNANNNNELSSQVGSKPTQSRHIQADTPQQSTVSSSSVARVLDNSPRAHVDARLAIRAPLPDGFCVTEQHVQYAGMHRLPSPHECILNFVNHHQAKGTQSSNWDAEFRKWLVRERGFMRARSNGNETHQPVQRQRRDRFAEALFGSPDPGLASAAMDTEAVGGDGSTLWPAMDKPLAGQPDAASGPSGVDDETGKVH